MSFQQGLSGLNASSKNLAVIGNNIANANTYGAKASRAEFSDVYAAALNGAGTNSIGIGVNVAAVAQQFTQGNITIQKMNTGTISIVDARLLKGNIQVQENSTATRLEVLRNQVAQNLEVFVNRGAGAKFVQTNTVSQKLSCKENTGPFTGRPNVAGDVEGQCRR